MMFKIQSKNNHAMYKNQTISLSAVYSSLFINNIYIDSKANNLKKYTQVKKCCFDFDLDLLGIHL